MSDETSEAPDAREAEAPSGSLPADFSTFVVSLNAAALIHLGIAPPGTSAPPKNLPLARQTIDLLAMLEEKTRGNLDGDEERLLSKILYDLRMRVLAESGGDTGP